MILRVGFLLKDLEGMGYYDPEESFRSAEITAIYKNEGDTVQAGEAVFTAENDKGESDFFSPVNGTIREVHYTEGETWRYAGTIQTSVGEMVLLPVYELETDEAYESGTDNTEETKDTDTHTHTHTSSDKQKADIHEKNETKSDPQERIITPVAKNIQALYDISDAELFAHSSDRRIGKDEVRRIAKMLGYECDGKNADRKKASPRARHLAKERGIRLTDVTPSSSSGIVYSTDVLAVQKSEGPGYDEANKEADVSQVGEEIITPSQIRKATAKMLTYSWKNIPHAGDTITVNVEQLARFRKTHNEFAETVFGTKLRYDHFFLYFVARHLATDEFRMLNNYWDADQEEIHVMPHVNLGIAIDAGYGLVVPVIRKAETYSFQELIARVEDYVVRAQKKKLTRADFLDLTFTVNNPGAFGGEDPSMIIPATHMSGKNGIRPTTMIIGLGKIAEQDMISREVNISFRFDHRIVDGRLPLAFMRSLKEWCEVENETQLLSQLK